MKLNSSFMINLLPLAAIVVGGVFGSVIDLPDWMDASLLALAAGLIVSSIVTEVAGEISDPSSMRGKAAVVFGIVGGALLMVFLRYLSDKSEAKGGGSESMVVWLTAIDFFIDGLMNGISSARSSTGSIALSVALAFESFIVTSAIVRVLEQSGMSKAGIIGRVSALFGSTLLGFVVGYKGVNHIGDTTKTGLFALSLPVFLWMVFKEFLPDSYKLISVRNSKWIDLLWMSTIALGIGIDWVAGD